MLFPLPSPSPAGPSRIFSWSKSRDFGKWNPGIFRDLLVECKGTFYGRSRPSSTALGGQNILIVRTHLKTHSGEKPNATNMDSSRRFEETFESTLWGKVKQMQPMWFRIFSVGQFETAFESSQWREAKQMQPMWLYTYKGRPFKESFEDSTTTHSEEKP